MARTPRAAPPPERNPGSAAEVLSAAAEIFAPPPPAGQSIHFVIGHIGNIQGVNSAFDLDGLTLLCKGQPDGRRMTVMAPLDDPRVCPVCVARRPEAVGSLVRVLTVLVTPRT